MLKKFFRKLLKLDQERKEVHELRNKELHKRLIMQREARKEKLDAIQRRNVTLQIAFTTGGKRRGL